MRLGRASGVGAAGEGIEDGATLSSLESIEATAVIGGGTCGVEVTTGKTEGKSKAASSGIGKGVTGEEDGVEEGKSR